MPSITLEQALFFRRENAAPELAARSPGFSETWLPEAERLIVGFGERPLGTACPLALFALPLTKQQVAVVRVADQHDVNSGRYLGFHFVVLARSAYEQYAGDPFVLAQKVPAVWGADGDLTTLTEVPSTRRTIAEVQAVLRRVKASALRDDEDPEAPEFARTVENSESPAMLGGAQVLVDGGKLLFERPAGDLDLLSGLWLLLPNSTRARRWPASFAFCNDLGFDAVALPRLRQGELEGYTTEEQAADYPPGSYELALQTAVEAGDQRWLDAVFQKRNSGEVVRLALTLLAAMLTVVLLGNWLGPTSVDSERPKKAAAAAGIVAVGDPWTALGMIEHGNRMWKGE